MTKEVNDKDIKGRRRFIKLAGASVGVAAIASATGFRPDRLISQVLYPQTATDVKEKIFDAPVAHAFYQSTGLQKFVQPLRGVGPGGIPVALPDGTTGLGGAVHYTLDVKQYTDSLHPSMGPTTLRGYSPSVALGEGAFPSRHLGGVIVAKRGKPVQITVTNRLGGLTHPIPIDRSIMGAMEGDPGDYQNRISTHLHGGYVPWISDGGPFSWFDPVGSSSPQKYGDSTPQSIYQQLNPNLTEGQAEYYYPNDQSARMMWYHDHAIGITRVNAYVGIASAYLIRDDFEAKLVKSRGLPNYVELGGNEIPIVIQEKVFVGDNILATDPTWTGNTSNGSLWYAHTYDPNRWELTGGNPPTDPSIIPEFFGDTMLANGTVYPEATVEPRRYRLRILNATQARFLNLQLYVDDGSLDSITLNRSTNAPTNDAGPDFLVIGTEGGFLPYPVNVPSNVPFNPSTLQGSLITAPAERWDLIVDFKDFAGKKIILYNDAPAPFPMGDPLNDYYPGSPNPTPTNPGTGPNTRQIMRFSVGTKVTRPKDDPLDITPKTDLRNGNDPLPVDLGRTRMPNIQVRKLTLNETSDGFGRLIQMEGTDTLPTGHTGQDFSRGYMDDATEVISLGQNKKKNEVWQIINLTGDTHPIHFHLVNVQIISRQPFDWANYSGGAPTFTGAARSPDLYEQGWKETVRVNPGEVINVYIPFKLPKTPFDVPISPRTGGYEYVWHCHILEHEEHDMMRPLVVT